MMAGEHKNARQVDHGQDVKGLFLVRHGISHCLIADSQIEAENNTFVGCLPDITKIF